MNPMKILIDSVNSHLSTHCIFDACVEYNKEKDQIMFSADLGVCFKDKGLEFSSDCITGHEDIAGFSNIVSSIIKACESQIQQWSMSN